MSDPVVVLLGDRPSRAVLQDALARLDSDIAVIVFDLERDIDLSTVDLTAGIDLAALAEICSRGTATMAMDSVSDSSWSSVVGIEIVELCKIDLDKLLAPAPIKRTARDEPWRNLRGRDRRRNQRGHK